MVGRRRRALEGSLFAAAAWLLYTRVHAPVHLDTTRDVLIARDCVEGGKCHFEGPLSSFARLAQGATWIHLLEAARWTGASVHAIEAIVWGLAGIAAGLVYFLAGDLHGRRGAVAAGVTFAAIVPLLVELPVLWNPSLLPLPSVLFFAAQRTFVQRRSAAALLVAALALGVIVDVHLAGILLLPGLIAPVLASRPDRSWLAYAACVAATPAFILASSWRAVFDDARELASRPAAVMSLIVALVIVAALLARRIARGGPHAAIWGTGIAYGLLLTGGSLVEGKTVRGWYWAPLSPVLAALAAGAFVSKRRAAWISAGKLAAAAGVLLAWLGVLWPLLSSEADEPPLWTLADAERCARGLGARGWTVQDALRGVDAEYGAFFVSPLIAFLPAGDRHRKDRIVLGKRRAGVGILLDAGFVAVVVEAPPIDFAAGERCVDSVCAPLVPGVPRLPGFAGLAYPCRWTLDPPRREDADYSLAYVLPVLTDARLTVAPDSASGWTLTRGERGRVVVRTTIPRGELWRDQGWPPALYTVE
jgi:hypothetical protein